MASKHRRRGRPAGPSSCVTASAEPAIVLRPLRIEDEAEWQQLRRENADHVQPVGADAPAGLGARGRR